MMPFSKSHPASSETRVPPSTLIHRSTLLIGSQPSCPVTTSGIRTILGAHKTDIKLTRRGWSCRVSFCDHPKFPDLATKYQFVELKKQSKIDLGQKDIKAIQKWQSQAFTVI